MSSDHRRIGTGARARGLGALVLLAGCLSDPQPRDVGGDGGADDGDAGPGDRDANVGPDANPEPHVVQIATGFSHTCAVISDGRLYCWGKNDDGQLGHGNSMDVPNVGDNEDPAELGPVPLGGLAIEVAAGNGHSCALLDGGDVRCWGRNNVGQCGYGTADIHGKEDAASMAPVVDLPAKALGIAAGADHTCAVLDDGQGSFYCWGENGDGRLGYGLDPQIDQAEDIGDDETPGSVGENHAFNFLSNDGRTISGGLTHTCGTNSIGTARCWGDSFNYRLGDGQMADDIGDDEQPAGESAAIPFGARDVKAGTNHSCALLEDRSVTCWGFGGYGALGYGTEADVMTANAEAVVDLDGGEVLQLEAGNNVTCVLVDAEEDEVRCWGNPATTGRLGLKTESPDQVGDDEDPISRPAVMLGQPAKRLSNRSGGAAHTCAILRDDSVLCWGDNNEGQLGYGDTEHVGDDEHPGEKEPVVILE